MKPKYIREKLNGKFVYPNCPNTIKSKEDLLRWFEHTGQFHEENVNDREHLMKHLPAQFITEISPVATHSNYTEIKMMFPRCKTSASLFFYQNECSRISL